MRPPQFDASGINVLDPNDKLGRKSRYITLVQERALERHLSNGGSGLTVDVGCGFGRLTPALARRGGKTIGIDPSEELIRFASERDATSSYLVGALPMLPLRRGSVGLLVLHNVLKPLMQMGKLHCVEGIHEYLSDDAVVAVVENFRRGHAEFIDRDDLVSIMKAEGLVETKFIPVRAARNPLLPFIRYGLVPERWLGRLADAEVDAMRRKTSVPRHQYWNTLVLFENRSAA